MAEPGDPNAPETPAPEVDHDAGVGFASAASLAGRPRQPLEVQTDPATRPDGGIPPRQPVAPTPPDVALPGLQASSSPRRSAGSRPREASAGPQGGSGLFAVYALILFAVPTLGVSAVIALLAVTGRPGPQDTIAASHFIYQQRTLWAGAVVALLGAILITVGLGVFVLFLLALWLILRGARGVLLLREGRAIPDPRAWLL